MHDSYVFTVPLENTSNASEPGGKNTHFSFADNCILPQHFILVVQVMPQLWEQQQQTRGFTLCIERYTDARQDSGIHTGWIFFFSPSTHSWLIPKKTDGWFEGLGPIIRSTTKGASSTAAPSAWKRLVTGAQHHCLDSQPWLFREIFLTTVVNLSRFDYACSGYPVQPLYHWRRSNHEPRWPQRLPAIL